jgi:AraC-like DNA-binding protein
MIRSLQKTKILKSYYYSVDDLSSLFNYRIIRAGHILAGPEYHISRESVPGHEFIFCLNGAGYVRVDNQTHRVAPRELAWLPVQWPHAHFPDVETPWEIFWMRVDGPNLDKLMALLSVQSMPVFRFAKPELVIDKFEAVFSRAGAQPLQSYATCEVLVASLLEKLLESRNADAVEPHFTLHKGLSRLIGQMHNHYNDDWDVDRLADYCHVSKSHLFRLFHATFGQTPLGWLRSYRIAQAKRLLIETNEPVSSISFRVGYEDPLHFSRDFKKRVGVSPKIFRERENW